MPTRYAGWLSGWRWPRGAASTTRHPTSMPLPGGVRLHAVLPPIVTGCTAISLRVLRPTTHGLDALQAVGSVSPEAGRLLRAIVAARLAFLVVGGTGSGKTTLRLRHTYQVIRVHAG